MTSGRVRRLLLSYATSGLSKSVAAAVQIIALPVVASSLGAERFGALMVLGAIGAVFCIPARGIPPTLSIGIAHHRGTDDDCGIGSQIRGAAVVSIALGIVALAVATVLLAWFGLPRLVGISSVSDTQDLAGVSAALFLLIVATYGFAWVEGVRTGYEQNHINNLFSLLGSVLALLGIALSWAFAPTLTGFFLAIYVTYPVVQLINLLLARRSVSNGGHAVTLRTIKSIARRSFSWSIAQAGIALNLQGTVWLAAHTAGLATGGLVGAVARLFQVISSLSLALLTPVLPTLRHSMASGDHSWSNRAVRITVTVAGVSLILFGAIVAIFGNALVKAWLGLDFGAGSIVFGGLGLLAMANIIPQLFYLVLMALGSARAASINLFLGGLCGIAIGALAMKPLGLAGLIWGQAIGMLFVACIPNTLLVFRRMRTEGVSAAKSPDNSPGDKISMSEPHGKRAASSPRREAP
jgi:O-antigen/teichoic acid export membrane protein